MNQSNMKRVLELVDHLPASTAVEIIEVLAGSNYSENEIKGVLATLDKLTDEKIDDQFARLVIAAILDSEQEAKNIFEANDQLVAA